MAWSSEEVPAVPELLDILGSDLLVGDQFDGDEGREDPVARRFGLGADVDKDEEVPFTDKSEPGTHPVRVCIGR